MPSPREHITKAADWYEAKLRGERLPEHELRCVGCGELSEAAVCARCAEAEAEARASGLGGSVA